MIGSLFAVALVVAASQSTGSIAGVIVDTTRLPIPGATLVVTADDNGVRRATTDMSGRYRFDGLPPGSYRRREPENRSASSCSSHETAAQGSACRERAALSSTCSTTQGAAWCFAHSRVRCRDSRSPQPRPARRTNLPAPRDGLAHSPAPSTTSSSARQCGRETSFPVSSSVRRSAHKPDRRLRADHW
jgi:hypothetical protein